jgi:glycosyltransferase involved in cell wall biosynthesis
MHIVFLARRFYPEIGGVEKHVLKLGEILVKKGHTISIITTRSTAQLLLKEQFENITIYRMDTGKNDWFLKFRVWKEMLRLRRIWQSADIIHAHDVFFWMLPFIYVFPTLKIFTTFHGYETVVPPTKKAVRARTLAAKKSCGTIIVGDFIKKWYGTKPDFVTYGGVDRIENLELKVSSFEEPLKIGLIGRLEADNGIEVYLSALKILKDKHVQFELKAYGEGSLKRDVEQFGSVDLVSDTTQSIEKCDIVFASSYLSILESLARGKTVFSVYNNSLKKDYLLMTPFAKWIEIENDSDRLAQKIQLLVEGKVKSNAFEAQKWIQHNTWEDVADMHITLWNKK